MKLRFHRRKRKKEVLSLHGLHSAESAFWGDRREAELTRTTYRKETQLFAAVQGKSHDSQVINNRNQTRFLCFIWRNTSKKVDPLIYR